LIDYIAQNLTKLCVPWLLCASDVFRYIAIRRVDLSWTDDESGAAGLVEQ